MLRILFGSLLLVHGLIHLIGFFSEWKLTAVSMLRGKTLFHLTEGVARFSGIVWLLTSLLWIAASMLYFLKRDSFLIPAIVAMLISQVLIVIYWQDAKFGTIANVIVLLVLIINVARVGFKNKVEKEIFTMINSAGNSVAHTTKAALPPVVARWLTASKSTGNIPSVVHLEQEGVMRASPSSGWMKFNATQTYTIDPPAFIWNSQINPGSLMVIAGRDKYENGKGNMLIKPLYIYSLANSSGPEIDQGTLLRYMAELIWFPEAAMMEYFEWEEISSTTALLKMSYNGVDASGVFTFGQDGLVKSFAAERYGNFDSSFRKEIWEIKVIENSLINGHLVGKKCEVTWKLKEGDFNWLNLEVKSINYTNVNNERN